MISAISLLLRIVLVTPRKAGSNSTHNPNITIIAPHSVIGSIVDLLISCLCLMPLFFYMLRLMPITLPTIVTSPSSG
jgi:uncharacterized protein YacL